MGPAIDGVWNSPAFDDTLTFPRKTGSSAVDNNPTVNAQMT